MTESTAVGRWAWWAPGPLARWWQRYGKAEGGTASSGTGPDSPDPLGLGQVDPRAART
jgi:hypothetical protein